MSLLFVFYGYILKVVAASVCVRCNHCGHSKRGSILHCSWVLYPQSKMGLQCTIMGLPDSSDGITVLEQNKGSTAGAQHADPTIASYRDPSQHHCPIASHRHSTTNHSMTHHRITATQHHSNPHPCCSTHLVHMVVILDPGTSILLWCSSISLLRTWMPYNCGGEKQERT